MPNWSYNRNIFEGKTKDLEEFVEKINEYTKQNLAPNGFGKNWLGNICIGFGFDYNDIPCRGTCESIITDSIEHNEDDEDGFIEIDTMTAWANNPEMWLAIIEKHKLNFKYHWYMEEEGMGDFYKTEGSDNYFPEKYYLHTSCNGNIETIYPETENDIIAHVNQTFGKTFENIDEVKEFADKLSDEDDDPEVFSENYIVLEPIVICDVNGNIPDTN